MPLAAGAHLGPYEIIAPLGAGGMGEVYRARDTRLDRTVAIKVLPGELSLNPQHRERFLREARAVSHLNHPHICTLHDIGSEGGIDYLVMEYIDGETLQHRLRKDALPIEEALRRGIEIADALDRAHRDHVVHRDLKPGNIMLTRSGAKILDFGLAKTGVGAKKPAGDETVTQALTSEGSILGTLQYMAPEQLEGKEADPRSDIFAFGAVLFEMIAGRKAFTGESPASIVASILTAEPPQVAEIPGASPLDRVIRKCLAKNPDRRWQTAADLKDELDWIASGVATSAPAIVPSARRNFRWVAIPVAAGLIAIWFAWHGQRGIREQSVWTLDVPPPVDKVFDFLQDDGNIAISPDGHLLVFPVLSSRGSQLWMRDLASGSDKPLPGTDDGHQPFWSPDSRFIGFFAGGKLKKIGLAGPPEVICTAGYGRGGSWNREGLIIFTPRSLSVVHRVSASGGDPVPITTLDPAHPENAHYWPHFLPDGRHFLYWARAKNPSPHRGVLVGSIDDKPTITGRSLLLKTATGAVYSPDRTGARGHLLYLRGGALVAQVFDPTRMRLSGEPIRVVDQGTMASSLGQLRASVSGNGVLVYGEAESTASGMLWKNRTGTTLREVGALGKYIGVRISSDGKRTAFVREDPEIGPNIWSLAPGGGITRVTLESSLFRDSPVWSPDDARIAFSSPGGGGLNMFTVPSSGSRAEVRLTPSTINQFPDDWSPDGRYLLFHQISPETQQDLWVLPLHSGAPPYPIVHTPFEEPHGRISPDGRWIAYSSNESGILNVYVQDFAALTGGAPNSPKWTVSGDGGSEPVWRRDGKEIFFRSLDGSVMSAPVESGGDAFRTGPPKLLFAARIAPVSESFTYDVSPNGEQFLMIEPVKQSGSRPLHVITDWRAAVQP